MITKFYAYLARPYTREEFMNIDQILLLFIQDYLRSDILSSRTFLLSMKNTLVLCIVAKAQLLKSLR